MENSKMFMRFREIVLSYKADASDDDLNLLWDKMSNLRCIVGIVKEGNICKGEASIKQVLTPQNSLKLHDVEKRIHGFFAKYGYFRVLNDNVIDVKIDFLEESPEKESSECGSDLEKKTQKNNSKQESLKSEIKISTNNTIEQENTDDDKMFEQELEKFESSIQIISSNIDSLENIETKLKEKNAEKHPMVPDSIELFNSETANEIQEKIKTNTQDESVQKKNDDIDKMEDEKPQVEYEKTGEKSINSNYRYALKNGRVGLEYSDELDFNKIPFEGNIIDYSIDGLEEIGGLKLIKEKKLITGIPVNQGDPDQKQIFTLKIRYETDKGVRGAREINLAIFSDPKSLWKTLEPPKELGDCKEHGYKKLIKTKDRNLLVASKRGRSHAHNATYRDDHCKISYMEDIKWSIMVVADGAGSAKLSRVGSRIACNRSIEYIEKQLIEKDVDLLSAVKSKNDKSIKNLLYYILSAACFESAKSIKIEADKRNKEMSDFHTTLLILIYKKLGTTNFIAGFWVGDGGLAIYSKEKYVKLLGTPDGGKFSGETKFMTQQEFQNPQILMDRIKYFWVDDFTALFAMSDGITDAKFGTDKNLESLTYWDSLWDELQRKVINKDKNIDDELLSWLDFWSDGEHDDRTLGIIY